MKICKFKHITVMYHQYIESVVKMFEEHYDTEEYDGTLFLLNYSWNYGEKRFINKFELPRSSRYIYYNLEHYETYFSDFNTWGFSMFFPWLESMNFDEIWEFAYENVRLMPKTLQKKVKFVPVRYTQSILDNPLDVPKTIDLCFLGVNDETYTHRIKFISDLQTVFFNAKAKKRYKFKMISGDDMVNFKDEISNCKYMLDTLNVAKDFRYPTTQNQVRIFECIMRGYKVISENVTGCNYFENLINILPYPVDSEIDRSLYYGYNILDILDKEYVNDYKEIREKYKAMTWKDDDFEKYKQNIINQLETLWY